MFDFIKSNLRLICHFMAWNSDFAFKYKQKLVVIHRKRQKETHWSVKGKQQYRTA